ncbi:hypothetical protein [Streptomyces antimycoticus]
MPASTQTDWPEGVIARYLTVGGATVDVRPDHDDKATQAWCDGCGRYDTTEWATGSYAREIAEEDARRWAQAHAEKCRAMPKPTA